MVLNGVGMGLSNLFNRTLLVAHVQTSWVSYRTSSDALLVLSFSFLLRHT